MTFCLKIMICIISRQRNLIYFRKTLRESPASKVSHHVRQCAGCYLSNAKSLKEIIFFFDVIQAQGVDSSALRLRGTADVTCTADTWLPESAEVGGIVVGIAL